MELKHSTHDLIRYTLYILVWCALLLCTGITVIIAGTNLGSFNIITAIFIASIKAALVLYFFMHLKNDEPLLKIMVLIVAVTLAVIIGMTFFDISYR